MKKVIPTNQKMAVPVDKVVAVVNEALTARRPRARYVAGIIQKLLVASLTKTPVAVRDRVMAAAFRQPRRARG